MMVHNQSQTLQNDQASSPVRLIDIGAQFLEHREEILACIERILTTGELIGGPEVTALEQELAAYCGTRCAVTLNSGTDALIMGLAGLGIGRGDEVIVPTNSFVASAAAVAHIGAIPVFADVRPDLCLDPEDASRRITERTRAIMPVHWTGCVADMPAITALAQKHDLYLVEDAAQAFGSELAGQRAGGFGDVGCFSAHPLKNLNAAGDAGFIVTDRQELADYVRSHANHGFIDRGVAGHWGLVSRMDTIQAALLRLRLRWLPDVIARRNRNAALYRRLLVHAPLLLPPDPHNMLHGYHLFIIQTDQRDELQAALQAQQIISRVHYPIPIHLQPAAADLGWKRGDLPEAERQATRTLSIPIQQALQEEEIERVAAAICSFYGVALGKK